MSNINDLTINQRVEILNVEVARLVSQGWVAESVAGTQAIMFRPRRIGWFWNILLTLVTSGFWLIIWVIRILKNKGQRIVIYVDDFGVIRAR